MKMKLAGLLVFSQAAQSATLGGELCSGVLVPTTNCPITRSNYQAKLCGSDFVDTFPEHTNPTDMDYNHQGLADVSSVKTAYDDYCYNLAKYNQAVNKKEGKKTVTEYNACKTAIDDECIVQAGIDLAKSCDSMKYYKKEKNHAFVHYLSRPTKSCNAPFSPRPVPR